jgi:Fanconi anemia group D2 protein
MSVLKELLQTFQPTENFDDDISEFGPPLVPSNIDYLYCGAYKMFEAIMDPGTQHLQFVPGVIED